MKTKGNCTMPSELVVAINNHPFHATFSVAIGILHKKPEEALPARSANMRRGFQRDRSPLCDTQHNSINQLKNNALMKNRENIFEEWLTSLLLLHLFRKKSKGFKRSIEFWWEHSISHDRVPVVGEVSENVDG